jgi:hypothetical protein
MTSNQRCDAIEYPALCYPMEGRPTWCGEHVARFTPPAEAVEPVVTGAFTHNDTDGTNPSDEFIRGSISGAKNAVATERLRRKLMPSDDGALEYQLERFEEAFRWLVDGRADGAINMQMAIAKMRTAIEATPTDTAKPADGEGA